MNATKTNEDNTNILDDPYVKYMHMLITNRTNGFWIGPYDIRIYNIIPYVPANDGVNQIDQFNRVITTIKTNNSLSEKEYKKKLCYLDADGFYYYNHYKFYRDKKYTCIDCNKKLHFYNIDKLYNNHDKKRMNYLKCVFL